MRSRRVTAQELAKASTTNNKQVLVIVSDAGNSASKVLPGFSRKEFTRTGSTSRSMVSLPEAEALDSIYSFLNTCHNADPAGPRLLDPRRGV